MDFRTRTAVRFDRLLARIESRAPDFLKSPLSVEGERLFQNREAYELESIQVPKESQPYCARCKETPQPYGPANVAADIRSLDANRVLSRSLQWTFTQWA